MVNARMVDAAALGGELFFGLSQGVVGCDDSIFGLAVLGAETAVLGELH